jgi:hypothetical protein
MMALTPCGLGLALFPSNASRGGNLSRQMAAIKQLSPTSTISNSNRDLLSHLYAVANAQGPTHTTRSLTGAAAG